MKVASAIAFVNAVLQGTRLGVMDKAKHKGEATRELLQALLDHFWQARREHVPREPRLFPAGYLISYSALIQRAGITVEARRLGGPLAEISALCDLRSWPPLAALVVRQDRGQPGIGYFRRPGSAPIDLVTDAHLLSWDADARACMDFKTLPRRAPAITHTIPLKRRPSRSQPPA